MLIYHLVDFDRGQKSYDWKDDVRLSGKPYLVRPYPTKKSAESVSGSVRGSVRGSLQPFLKILTDLADRGSLQPF